MAVSEGTIIQDGENVTNVESFSKPKYEKCQHQKLGSRCCRIYEIRPKACVNFTCAWLQGLGSKKDRPDLSGIVFTQEDTILGQTLLGLETRPGLATPQHPVVQLALQTADKFDLGVIIGGVEKRNILRIPRGKEAKVALALQVATGMNLGLNIQRIPRWQEP
jgi:hypothetical protein